MQPPSYANVKHMYAIENYQVLSFLKISISSPGQNKSSTKITKHLERLMDKHYIILYF